MSSMKVTKLTRFLYNDNREVIIDRYPEEYMDKISEEIEHLSIYDFTIQFDNEIVVDNEGIKLYYGDKLYKCFTKNNFNVYSNLIFFDNSVLSKTPFPNSLEIIVTDDNCYALNNRSYPNSSNFKCKLPDIHKEFLKRIDNHVNEIITFYNTLVNNYSVVQDMNLLIERIETEHITYPLYESISFIKYYLDKFYLSSGIIKWLNIHRDGYKYPENFSDIIDDIRTSVVMNKKTRYMIVFKKEFLFRDIQNDEFCKLVHKYKDTDIVQCYIVCVDNKMFIYDSPIVVKFHLPFRQIININ